MITLLKNFFIKEGQTELQQRGAYGMLCGVAGIILNLILFVGKIAAGIFSNSIAITADAINNLSDASSSVVTLVGFKMAGQKPDADHPYGHGRIEYVAGFVVAVVILVMGVELIRDSVGKILNPEDTVFSWIAVVVLAFSILIKCYMAFYNRRIGKQIESAALMATATDSLSDCISTFVVLVSLLASHFFHWNIDGYCGVLVGLLILYAGISAAKDTIDPILGQPPEKEFVEEIEEYVLHFNENVIGVHDLMVHDYGPGRRIISLHAEVPAEGNILELHDIIDNLEGSLSLKMNCITTIHMDPVVTTDPQVDLWKEQVKNVVRGIDPVLSIHDFRVVIGNTHTNFIFDVVAPFEFALSDEELTKKIDTCVKEQIGELIFCVIQVDKDYVKKGEK